MALVSAPRVFLLVPLADVDRSPYVGVLRLDIGVEVAAVLVGVSLLYTFQCQVVYSTSAHETRDMVHLLVRMLLRGRASELIVKTGVAPWLKTKLVEVVGVS